MRNTFGQPPASINYQQSENQMKRNMVDMMMKSDAQAKTMTPMMPNLAQGQGAAAGDVAAQVQAMRALAARGRLAQQPHGGPQGAMPKSQRDLLILLQMMSKRGMGPRRRPVPRQADRE